MRTSISKFFGRTLAAAVFVSLAAIAFVSANAQSVSLDAVLVADGFDRPLYVTAPPGDTSRIFIVQQTGQILIVNLPSGTVNPTPYLDISSRIVDDGNEQGLLGMAFDPNYATNGRFYVNYTAPGGAFGSGVTHIGQYRVKRNNPNVADTTELTLLTFDQPQINHNGGWIGFSPRPGDQNNLYIATGDGGGSNDAGEGHIEPGGNGQSTQTLLAKMLRIHIEAQPGTYSIPPDNPFFGSDTDKQEIWAFGLRNPFRDSFDRVTGTMFIGDVGQATREELDVQKPSNPGGGENYGWRFREGFVKNPAYPTGHRPPGAVDPILDYPHSTGQVIIGGYVYRGREIPDLRGTYVFGDNLGPEDGDFKGLIFTAHYNGQTVSDFEDITADLFPTRIGNFQLQNPSSFGEDANGELYICSLANGIIFKIVPGQ